MTGVVMCDINRVMYEVAAYPSRSHQARHRERYQPGLSSPTSEELTHAARSIRVVNTDRQVPVTAESETARNSTALQGNRDENRRRWICRSESDRENEISRRPQ